MWGDSTSRCPGSPQVWAGGVLSHRRVFTRLPGICGGRTLPLQGGLRCIDSRVTPSVIQAEGQASGMYGSHFLPCRNLTGCLRGTAAS